MKEIKWHQRSRIISQMKQITIVFHGMKLKTRRNTSLGRGREGGREKKDEKRAGCHGSILEGIRCNLGLTICTSH